MRKHLFLPLLILCGCASVTPSNPDQEKKTALAGSLSKTWTATASVSGSTDLIARGVSITKTFNSNGMITIEAKGAAVQNGSTTIVGKWVVIGDSLKYTELQDRTGKVANQNWAIAELTETRLRMTGANNSAQTFVVK